MQPDPLYTLAPEAPPPAGIPDEPDKDAHAEEPFAPSFGDRRAAFLDYVRCNPPPRHLAAAFHELARLEAGGPLFRGLFESALDYIEKRRDCADFVSHAMLRLIFQFGQDPRVPDALLERARRVLLGFKFWPDEPGIDSLCTWTENHQILFASSALLAGQHWPQERFANSGETGAQKAQRARPRIERWLDLRFRTGFSEWLSNVYYDEDLVALLSLVDFAGDAGLRDRAAMVADLLLLDIALGSHLGVFGTSHGRSYERSKKWAEQEGTTSTGKLLFGTGRFARHENMSAAALALSRRYRMPRVLEAVAREVQRVESTNRQRMGIRLAEAARWGLGFRNFEDGMIWLGLEAYLHPRSIELVVRMFDAFRWWQNGFFAALAARRRWLRRLQRMGLLPAVARLFEHDLTRNLREEVNLLSYRTPDYLLGSALDWRAGYGGDQQSIWQATLGPDAVCFTTHPGPLRGSTPDLWTGSGTLPRVGQVENVVICVYRIGRRPALHVPNRHLYSHAWLPRDRFDEVVEREGWIFARRREGYLALRSARPYHWQRAPGEDRDREVIAPGRRNIWICELGRRARDGHFGAFVERIARAELRFGRKRVCYHSPSQGRIEFGWRGPLLRDGRVVPLADHPRYENPWVEAPFPAQRVEVRCGGEWLKLDWREGRREASGYVA